MAANGPVNGGLDWPKVSSPQQSTSMFVSRGAGGWYDPAASATHSRSPEAGTSSWL